MLNSPFHEGETAVQERVGERDIARRHGAIISPRVADGALLFLARQQLAALSSTGDDGGLWTSVWCGEPGFMQSADGSRVNIQRSLLAVSPDDPVLQRLTIGRDVGMLAIELSSRRRLRINGAIDRVSADEIGVAVRESVPNCPKYIQRRHLPEESGSRSSQKGVDRGRAIDQERRALIEHADTSFVGSLHPVRGADVSHRGGPPGFIRVVDDTTLRIPDYPGNSMYMTLGNFEIDSRAGLAVVDFARGRIVSLSGAAQIRFDVEDSEQVTGGTGRFWDLSVREWLEFDLPPLARWELVEFSPFNPPAARR